MDQPKEKPTKIESSSKEGLRSSDGKDSVSKKDLPFGHDSHETAKANERAFGHDSQEFQTKKDLPFGHDSKEQKSTTDKSTESFEAKIAERRIDNEKLRHSSQFEVDKKKVGVTDEQISRMDAKEVPLGFKDKAEFEEFKKDADKALKDDGLDDASVGLKGTSTTFYSENPKKPYGHHWDADPNPKKRGDYDLNITSSTMADRMKQDNVGLNKECNIYSTSELNKRYPALSELSQKWKTQLGGRDVNFVGYPEPRQKDRTEFSIRTSK